MNKFILSFREEREIIEYSNRVFNYFNGRVNKNILAELNIRNNFDKSVLATAMFNQVNLYLSNIIEYYPKYELMNSIVINIVHELCHVEQDIDYIKYNLDPQYNSTIENENSHMTYRYLYDNINDINRDLGCNLDIHYLVKLCDYYNKYEYKSTTLEKYYKQCLRMLLYNGCDDIDIENTFNNDNIILNFNGMQIILKLNGCIIDNVNQFNHLISIYNNSNRSYATSNVVYDSNNGICYIVMTLYSYHSFK